MTESIQTTILSISLMSARFRSPVTWLSSYLQWRDKKWTGTAEVSAACSRSELSGFHDGKESPSMIPSEIDSVLKMCSAGYFWDISFRRSIGDTCDPQSDVCFDCTAPPAVQANMTTEITRVTMIKLPSDEHVAVALEGFKKFAKSQKKVSAVNSMKF